MRFYFWAYWKYVFCLYEAQEVIQKNESHSDRNHSFTFTSDLFKMCFLKNVLIAPQSKPLMGLSHFGLAHLFETTVTPPIKMFIRESSFQLLQPVAVMLCEKFCFHKPQPTYKHRNVFFVERVRVNLCKYF